MILVDTSVWVRHLRDGVFPLVRALERADVLGHPFVTGELACSSLPRRARILGLLDAMPQAQRADDAEVRALVEHRKLAGRGVGWVDAHLLAAALLSDARLWTDDRRLAAAAAQCGVAHRGA